MLPKIWYGGKFFLWAMLMMGMDLKISFGHALEGFMFGIGAAQNMVLPKIFVLFPSGLLAGLRLASSFPKILYCSLLACLRAFGRRPPSAKFCIVPFWLVGRPSAGILLPKNFVLFPFGVSFWLVGQPSAGLLLPQNLVRGVNFFLSFLVKSLREPRSNKFSWKWFIFKMLLIKLVLLIRYSDKKIIFRKIELIFGLQNWLWKLKLSNFWQSSIKRSYKISKVPLRGLIEIQKTIEFHLYHWKILQPSSY